MPKFQIRKNQCLGEIKNRHMTLFRQNLVKRLKKPIWNVKKMVVVLMKTKGQRQWWNREYVVNKVIKTSQIIWKRRSLSWDISSFWTKRVKNTKVYILSFYKTENIHQQHFKGRSPSVTEWALTECLNWALGGDEDFFRRSLCKCTHLNWSVYWNWFMSICLLDFNVC